ncbi:MAG TPA: RNA polymerase sigma factor [Polyangiaceae bacterium]|nr:RNA polymerase sigma factor [Polyangiaceae bacterium]
MTTSEAPDCSPPENTSGPASSQLTARAEDAALVLAIQRGDRTQGRELYQRLVRVIEVTLTRVVGPGAPEHDDLLQATFEQVIRTLRDGSFQGRCSLASWAAAIACRIGLNAIRARRAERAVVDRSVASDEQWATLPGQDLERTLAARDELRRVRLELASMSSGRAEAVLLCDVLGYAMSEVAASTGLSVAAVESRLVRGRRDLIERIGSWPERSCT